MSKILTILIGGIMLTSCDFYHFDECEWTLEPEHENLSKLKGADIDSGFIPVCARNRVTNKQNCNLKAKLDYAKKVFGKKFKYNDMKVDADSKFPKPVLEIKSFCK